MGNTAILKKNSRSADVCSRFGGEEFVIVMLETTKENGSAHAERLRKEVEERIVTFDGGSL